MTTLLQNFTSISTWLLDQVGNILTLIGEQPLLLVPIGIFVVGAGVGFVKRLLS